ncbi:hypothetical protein [Chitinophaga sp.]|uniref:hypothetical protein n=1 Tax=Chitinophaga sp. TaxID=1869181 RepID=UPI0031E18D41
MKQEITRKVLVIDDNEMHYKRIKDRFSNKAANVLQVYPEHGGGKKEECSYFGHINTLVQRRDFKTILDYYHFIDLFIIDSILIESEKDTGYTLGFELGDYIKRNFPRDVKIIYISNIVDCPKKDLDPTREFFLSKSAHRMYFEEDLLVKALEMLNIDPGEVTDHDNTPQPTDTMDPFFLRKYKFRDLARKFGISYAINAKLEQWGPKVTQAIDFMLLYFVFNLLLLSTIIYSTWHIIDAFWLSSTPNGDTAILRKAEKLFLYLLPIFIVQGFIIYYRTYVRVHYIEGEAAKLNEARSTGVMNLTKVLFIASVVSYMLIKVIEVIFPDLSEVPLSRDERLLRLIATGVFLLMLMVYFLFLNRKH